MNTTLNTKKDGQENLQEEDKPNQDNNLVQEDKVLAWVLVWEVEDPNNNNSRKQTQLKI